MSKIHKIVNAIALTTTLLIPLWVGNNTTTTKSAQTKYYETHLYNRFRNSLLEQQLKIEKNNNINENDNYNEEDEQDELTYIIEETFYIDLDVPVNKPFKSYMDARMITDRNSSQYKLKSEYELDSSGIYIVDGRYACAVGSYYTNNIGTYFDIVMTSGEVIPCILADCKADEHTDSLGQYTLGNDSIVEFIVHEPTLIPNISNQCGNTGDVSTLGGMFEGEISYIRIYF